jgi:hypothetical protein
MLMKILNTAWDYLVMLGEARYEYIKKHGAAWY